MSWRPLLQAGLLVFLVLAVDALVLPRNILNYRDSLEMVTASALLQPAHPPGFPLYVLLTRFLVSLLPLAWPLYSRFAAVNALYGALALALFSACVSRLTASALFGALAALTLAWSYSYWLYRLVPEVFMLGNLASMLSLWLLLHWRQAPESRSRWLLFGFSLGVGVVCHPITVVWWPALAWGVLTTVPPRRLPALILQGSASLVAGLALFLLDWPLVAKPHPPLWGLLPEHESLVTYLLRRDYGGLQSAGAISLHTGFQAACLMEYARQLAHNFGPALLLPLVGALWLVLRRRRWFDCLLPIAALVSGPIFILYGQFKTESPFYLGSAEPLYLPSIMALVAMTAVAMAELLRGASARRRRLAAVVAGCLILLELGMSYPRVDRHDHALSKDYSLALLGRLPPHAVLIVSDDKDLFAAAYEVWATAARSDVALLNYGFIHKPDYRTELARAHPDLKFNDALTPSVFMRRFLKDNQGGRPIFFATLRDAPLWGVNGDPFFLMPMGKVFEVVTDRTAAVGGPSLMPFSNELGHAFDARDFWDLELLISYRRAWINLGERYIKLGLIDRARSLYEQVSWLDPNASEWRRRLAELDKPAPPPRLATSEALHQAAMAAVNDHQYEQAIFDFERALDLDPGNALLMNKLAVVLYASNDPRIALPYARRALELDGANPKYAADVALIEAALR